MFSTEVSRFLEIELKAFFSAKLAFCRDQRDVADCAHCLGYPWCTRKAVCTLATLVVMLLQSEESSRISGFIWKLCCSTFRPPFTSLEKSLLRQQHASSDIALKISQARRCCQVWRLRS